MRAAALIIAAFLLTACAGQDTVKQQAIDEAVQAVRDFIAVRGLEETAKMPSASSDSWESIENYFLIYESRRDTFLVEFSRRCYELDDNMRIVPDERREAGIIRSRFDTIRGCRIHRLYALTADEAEELRNLGEAPGERN
jgi:hypothetical protein